MTIIIPANSAVTAAYDVDNSCKFNIADGAEMAQTLSTPTDRDKWTFSAWLKIGSIGEHGVFDCHEDASNYGYFELGTNGQLTIFDQLAGSNHCILVTSRLFRDFSAWYHFVIAWDSGQGVAADRVKLYINGVQETAFSTETYPSQDENSAINSANPHNLARKDTHDTHNYDGYMAEVVFIDGQSLTPTSFGEFDEDSPTIWKPKKVSGLTFGNNGFYLDFADSADLGDDESGNTNDFTETNLAAADQCVDSPTNNLSTLNPLIMTAASQPVFSDGNNVVVTQPGAPSTAHYMGGFSSYGMSSGLWYVECKAASVGSPLIGIAGTRTSQIVANNRFLGFNAYEWGYNGLTGDIIRPGTTISYGDTYTTGDIIGIFLDLNANKLYFAKNGTIQNSGTGLAITATTITGQPNTYFFTASQYGAVCTFNWNFGNGTFASTAVTSAVADANGFGLFEYDPSDGGSASFDSSAKDFLCLCSKNIGSDGG